MTLIGACVGPVGFIGIPGEPFSAIGIGLKEAEGYSMVLPLSLTNGADGYYPMMDCYEEGGYETSGSPFKAGVGEMILKEGLALLSELRRVSD
jgi:hypothetical protein